MEKTSKITKSQFKNEWTNPQTNTKVYYHDLEFDNGDSGSIGTKEMNPSKIAVGQTLTYTIDNGKIKAIQQSFKGGGFKQEPFEHKAAGFSISFAKDIYIKKLETDNSLKVDDMLNLADKIYNWLINKKVS